MTKALMRKNIKLGMDFDRYVARNPRVLDNLPKASEIIVTSERDKKLSEANLAIARGSRTGRFVVAHRVGKHWKLMPLLHRGG